MKKDVTINELAVMVNAGFSSVEKRFSGVDGRLDGIEKRFDGVDRRLDRLETDMQEVQGRLSSIGREIMEIHKHVVYRDEFEDLTDRVKYLELKLGTKSGK